MATELCKQLLERGWHVRATVRNKADDTKTGHLLRLAQVISCLDVLGSWTGVCWLANQGISRHFITKPSCCCRHCLASWSSTQQTCYVLAAFSAL